MPTVSDYAPCRVPLKRMRLWDGITAIENAAWIVVHAGAAASISRIEARIIKKNRELKAQGKKPYLIRKVDTGAYNCRKTTSGSSWSKHSYGCAVDVNWQTNPYSRTLRTDMPGWFVDIWLGEGWGWGGAWSGTKDAMHFSKFPNEGGDGKLYVGEFHNSMGNGEDWFDMASKAELEAAMRSVLRSEADMLSDPAKRSESALWPIYKALVKDVKQQDGKTVTVEHLSVVENIGRAHADKDGLDLDALGKKVN